MSAFGADVFVSRHSRHRNRGLKAVGQSRKYSKTDRKSTRLNSSHGYISYAVFCLKKKKKTQVQQKQANPEPNTQREKTNENENTLYNTGSVALRRHAIIHHEWDAQCHARVRSND